MTPSPRRLWAGLAVAALLCSIATTARAQGVEGGYFPSGGGTFVPFRGGPGGGLGVSSSGMRAPSPSPSGSRFMGGMPGAGAGMGAALGAPGGPTALRPIGLGAMGRGMGTGGLLNRSSAAPAMKAMPRPPVGSYPFRIPPSLRGNASQGPAMAM